MAEESRGNTLFRMSPVRYGIASLIAGCLCWASWPLVVVFGLLIVFCIELPLVLVAIVSGLLGVGTGIYHRNLLGIATGSLGLVLIGCGAWAVSNAIMHF